MSKSRPMILVVEGKKLFADLLMRELSSLNVQAFSAVCVEDARDILNKSLPDLCIVDLDLPDLARFVKDLRLISPDTTFIGLTSTSSQKVDGINTLVARAGGLSALRTALTPYLEIKGEAQILVVDDEQEIRDLVSEFLTDKGYTVLTAGDGKEAVRLVENNRDLSVVLLDLHMPGKGGMEALKEIRRMNPSVQVIMVTAMSDREIAMQAIALGAFDYIVKPFDMAIVEDLVAACMSRAELRRRSWWRRLVR